MSIKEKFILEFRLPHIAEYEATHKREFITLDSFATTLRHLRRAVLLDSDKTDLDQSHVLEMEDLFVKMINSTSMDADNIRRLLKQYGLKHLTNRFDALKEPDTTNNKET